LSLAVVASIAGVTLGAAPAVAQTGDPTGSTTATTAPTLGTFTPDALAQAVQVAIEYTNANAQLTTVTRELTDLQHQLDVANQAFQTSDQQYSDIANQIDAARYRLRGRAVASYKNHSQLIGSELEIQHVQSVQAGTQYVRDAATADLRAVQELSGRGATLKAVRENRAQAVRDLQAQQVTLNTERDKLTAQAASDKSQLESLGGIPVMGESQLGAQQIAAWFHSTGQTAHLAGGYTIEELAQLYVDEGSAATVRGDIAFAQAIIETGSFGHATDNNFAGIGACDSCTGEPSFPTPRDGVRAQVQLLRSYADPASTTRNLGNLPDPTLFGQDPTAAANTFDNFSLKGKVPLWNQMGHGNWATDPNYAGKVLKVYLRMLTFGKPQG
jgi:mannosyl-glycoprotein endo-beta-N-acetylglucosaminidase